MPLDSTHRQGTTPPGIFGESGFAAKAHGQDPQTGAAGMDAAGHSSENRERIKPAARGRFHVALLSYAVLGVLAYATLDDPRMWQFVLIFLGGMAFLTWNAQWRKQQEQREKNPQASRQQEADP